MISAPADRCRVRVRSLFVGLLLLSLPACGLSDYEEKMRETQQREERLREETKYLDAPVKIPTEKDKDGREFPVANVFFQPPRGIQSAFQTEQIKSLLWRYLPRTSGGDFARIELAFAADDKEFAKKVMGSYLASGAVHQENLELKPPGRDRTSVFQVSEFDNGQEGYSINILWGGRTQVAVIYIFPRTRRDSVRKAIELSLESLGVDGQDHKARRRYEQKSPWRLTVTPTP